MSKKWLVGVFIIMSVMASFAIAEDNNSNLSEIEAQIQLIDIEILVLRAELARKNGKVRLVQSYLNRLSKMNPPNTFFARIAALKYYLQITPPVHSVIASDTFFTFNSQNMVVLLPLTGTYGSAGREILQGILSEIDERYLSIIDTAIYDDAFELWDLVRFYQPSFIFGPLRKEMVQGLVDLNIAVPALMFNQVEQRPNYIKTLSPSRLDDVDVLMKQILLQRYSSVLVLTSQDKRSQQLAKSFYQIWSKLPEEDWFILTQKTTTKNIDKDLYKVLGSKSSTGRSSWLQKTLGMPLKSRTRSRQDIDAIISFVPYKTAVQISPLLAFYGLRQMSHVWFPASLPSAERFSQTLPFWLETTAVLPFFQAQKIQSHHHFQQQSLLEPTVGIFYALGEVAVQLSRHITTSGVNQVRTSLGNVEITTTGDLIIKPQFYWLDSNEMVEIKRP